jgi:hypothetical protein
MSRIEVTRPRLLGTVRLLLLFSVVSVASSISYNCNTVTSSGDDVDDGLVRHGDKVYICLHFLPQNIKVGFNAEVDAHIALTIRDMFPAFMHQDTDIIVQLSNSEYLSPQMVS